MPHVVLDVDRRRQQIARALLVAWARTRDRRVAPPAREPRPRRVGAPRLPSRDA